MSVTTSNEFKHASAQRGTVDDKLGGILAEIRDLASLPLEKAKGLPPIAYTSPELAELEREKIFQKCWVLIGRADQLPNPGDYLAHEIDSQPVVSIRQKDGTIRTFSNTCLHRFTTLLVGQGHLEGMIVCPYHAWSYNQSGQLKATPYAPIQNEPACKAGEIRLQEFATEVWEGFLFATLNPTPRPLAPQVDGMLRTISGHGVGRFKHVGMHDLIWDANWKLTIDNFIESYHLFMVHKTSLEPFCPTRLCKMTDGSDAWAIHSCPMTPDSDEGFGLAHHAKVGVPEGERNQNVDFSIFPGTVAMLHHNYLWWTSSQPMGVDKVKIRWGSAVLPEVLEDKAFGVEFTKQLDDFIDLAMGEDQKLMPRINQGAHSSATKSGRLTPLDQPIWEFIKYLDRSLNVPAAPSSVLPRPRRANAG
jgi:choline monooxygenase